MASRHAGRHAPPDALLGFALLGGDCGEETLMILVGDSRRGFRDLARPQGDGEVSQPDFTW